MGIAYKINEPVFKDSVMITCKKTLFFVEQVIK